MVYRALQAKGIEITEYHPHRAAFSRWDIVHIHWPESVFDHTLLEAIPTTESLLWATARAQKKGAKLLWTVHNLRAHEYKHTHHEEHFWRRFLRQLDGIVALTATGLEAAQQRFPELRDVASWVVPHPHYRGQYADTLSRAEARARLGLHATAKVLLVFGRMYEYKDVPALLRAFRELGPAEDVVVLVAGRPRSPEITQDFRRVAEGNPRIHFHLRFIAPEETQWFFRAADLVVQPYREILNSGTALLALSFDRPVLLPHHGAGIDLHNDLGKPWVHSYSGTLTGNTLRETLAVAKTLPERTNGEHVAHLDPEVVGNAMARVFEELVSPPNGVR